MDIIWLTELFCFFSRTLLHLSRRSLTRSTTRRGIASWAATSALTWRTRRATSSTSTSVRSPSSCSRAARRYIPLALNFVLLAAAVLSGLQSRPPPELSEAGRAPSPQQALPGAAPAAGGSGVAGAAFQVYLWREWVCAWMRQAALARASSPVWLEMLDISASPFTS